MRRGEHKCRILEMHLVFKDEQVITALLLYRLLYQSLLVTANLEATVDTHTRTRTHTHTQRNQNTTVKVNHQIKVRGTKEEKRPTKTNRKQLTKWQ